VKEGENIFFPRTGLFKIFPVLRGFDSEVRFSFHVLNKARIIFSRLRPLFLRLCEPCVETTLRIKGPSARTKFLTTR